MKREQFIKKCVSKDVGVFAEVGVYKGYTARIMSVNMIKGSELYLFDTFEGLPNKSDEDNFHQIGDFDDASYIDIVKIFENNKEVFIHKGIFPEETSHEVRNKKFDFVHLDVDMYISYKESLDFFYDKMKIGGIILFDDYKYKSCEGATLAVDEFFSDKSEEVQKYGTTTNNRVTEGYYIIKN